MVARGRQITRDEFFYVRQNNYDEHAELAIPDYRQMHEVLVKILLAIWPNHPPLRVLDLGAGTGKTSGVILDKFRGATVKAVDLFEEMLEHAKLRLEEFEDRVEYVQGDFMEIELGEGYDVCVSSLAVHHQTAEGKQELFERIFKALAPGGRFLMIDWVRLEEPTLHELSFEVAAENLQRAGLPARIEKAWKRHWRNKNIPETVPDLCSWLQKAGFRRAECVIKHYEIALICAEKE